MTGKDYGHWVLEKPVELARDLIPGTEYQHLTETNVGSRSSHNIGQCTANDNTLHRVKSLWTRTSHPNWDLRWWERVKIYIEESKRLFSPLIRDLMVRFDLQLSPKQMSPDYSA
jgi:hypothetical protein